MNISGIDRKQYIRAAGGYIAVGRNEWTHEKRYRWNQEQGRFIPVEQETCCQNSVNKEG